jgi:hypothetical protein
VLRDLAEQVKVNDERSARAAERSARAEEQAAAALERCAQLDAKMDITLQTISSLLQDFRAFAGRTESRLNAVERAAGPPGAL